MCVCVWGGGGGGRDKGDVPGRTLISVASLDILPTI